MLATRIVLFCHFRAFFPCSPEAITLSRRTPESPNRIVFRHKKLRYGHDPVIQSFFGTAVAFIPDDIESLSAE
jgi:hypothetical protein